MSEFKNTTHLPDDIWQKIGEMTQEMRLANILEYPRKAAVVPSNARPYRQWSAAMKCFDMLLETTLPAHTAFVTLTTRCLDAQWGNPKLSRILEKVLVPHCVKWVRFFHRSRKGYLHWHLVVSLKCPVLKANHEFWTLGEGIRRWMSLDNCPYEKAREIDKVLSDSARALTERCCAALRKAGIGYKARIEPIIYPEKSVNTPHGICRERRVLVGFQKIRNSACGVLPRTRVLQTVKCT